MPTRAIGLSCPRCNRTFTSDTGFVDLTLTSGIASQAYKQCQWAGTEMFRSPVVSWVYERGWRQNFAWYGFPGPDKEFDMAMERLQPAYGKVLVDMSCGSGLFTRRFARSGRFSGVVAADFSENMLLQTKTFLQERDTSTSSSSPVLLLRADVGRLPFATGSVAALHAGAAIHCWPNPQAALAEISRVLAPGGVFVGTTILVNTAPLGQVLGESTVRPLTKLPMLGADSLGSSFRLWEEEELRDLATAVGLQGWQSQRQWRFIMFSVRKPLDMSGDDSDSNSGSSGDSTLPTHHKVDSGFSASNSNLKYEEDEEDYERAVRSDSEDLDAFPTPRRAGGGLTD